MEELKVLNVSGFNSFFNIVCLIGDVKEKDLIEKSFKDNKYDDLMVIEAVVESEHIYDIVVSVDEIESIETFKGLCELILFKVKEK